MSKIQRIADSCPVPCHHLVEKKCTVENVSSTRGSIGHDYTPMGGLADIKGLQNLTPLLSGGCQASKSRMAKKCTLSPVRSSSMFGHDGPEGPDEYNLP